MKRYVTINEAAAIAGKTPRMIRYWITGGKLPAEVNDSGRYRVLASDVRRAIVGTWRPAK